MFCDKFSHAWDIYLTLFLASISALSSSSSNLKSYSVKNSSITQYRPGGQVETSWIIEFWVLSQLCFILNRLVNTLFKDLLFLEGFLSNLFQNSSDFKFSDILDVYELIDSELDLIDEYEAEEELEVIDPDDDVDVKVSE